MADDEELYLANLDEFVNDEDKIVSLLLVHEKAVHFIFGIFIFLVVLFQVTYKWLSRTLSVSVNRAKQ